MNRQFGSAFHKLSLLVAIVSLSGCMIPEGTKVTSGHEFPKDAISFLDDRGVTRAETISNFGPPSWESSDARVILYLWRTTFDWLFVPPESKTLGLHNSHVWTDEKRMALLIAYNEQGQIVHHEVCPISEEPLETVCVQWSQRTR
jgi:hypothetical protein